MQILVKSMLGKGTILQVIPSDTIEDVKARLYNEEGYHPKQQRLFFAEKELLDGHTLSDYNVQPLSTLNVMLTLSGKRAARLTLKIVVVKFYCTKLYHELYVCSTRVVIEWLT